MAEDTEKEPKTPENTNTEDSSVGKAQEPSGYSYDVAEDTIENKKGQLHIKVQKSIDETEQTSIISETTTCEYKSEKRTQNDTTNVIYKYDSLSGNSEHTTEFSNASTFNRKGILKTSTERHSEHTVHERGALGLSQGLTEPIEYGYNSVKKYTFDKNNNITSTHQHYNRTASSGSCVSDEYATYKWSAKIIDWEGIAILPKDYQMASYLASTLLLEGESMENCMKIAQQNNHFSDQKFMVFLMKIRTFEGLYFFAENKNIYTQNNLSISKEILQKYYEASKKITLFEKSQNANDNNLSLNMVRDLKLLRNGK